MDNELYHENKNWARETKNPYFFSVTKNPYLTAYDILNLLEYIWKTYLPVVDFISIWHVYFVLRTFPCSSLFANYSLKLFILGDHFCLFWFCIVRIIYVVYIVYNGRRLTLILSKIYLVDLFYLIASTLYMNCVTRTNKMSLKTIITSKKDNQWRRDSRSFTSSLCIQTLTYTS